MNKRARLCLLALIFGIFNHVCIAADVDIESADSVVNAYKIFKDQNQSEEMKGLMIKAMKVAHSLKTKQNVREQIQEYVSVFVRENLLEEAAYCVLKIDIDGMIEQDKIDYARDIEGYGLMGVGNGIAVAYMQGGDPNPDRLACFDFEW